MIKEIRITCDASHYFSLNEFNELQGDLKELDELRFNKLKLSILKYGFAFPYFAWKDSKGKLWIIDAHQRTRVLKHLRDVDGYLIPKLPTNLIQAKDRRQAKELLLVLNSNYGKMTNEGLYSFINESGFEIDLSGMEMLDFGNFDIETFKAGYLNDISINENDYNDLIYNDNKNSNSNENLNQLEIKIKYDYNEYIQLDTIIKKYNIDISTMFRDKILEYERTVQEK